MLTWDEMATGFLSCSDFETGPRALTIRALTREDVMKMRNGNPVPVKDANGKQVYENGEPKLEMEEKIVMFFDETSAGLIINKTNKALIKAMFGLPTTTWKGKRIGLYAAPECKTATRNEPAQPGLRVYGSPDIPKALEVVTGLRPQPKRVWTLVKMETAAQVTTSTAPRPLPDILAAIPRGEAKLTPEALATAREPYAILDDTDLSACPEPLVRGYFEALSRAVKGA